MSKKSKDENFLLKEKHPRLAKSLLGSIRKLSDELWWRACWLAPNFFSDPNFDKDWNEKSNEESRIDEGEELRIRAVWGIELFGPNESESLYFALRALGWSAGFGLDEGGALNWVRLQRAYGYGGTYNVGVVNPTSNSQRFIRVQNHTLIPEDVDYLLVRLHQIVPAVTCVVVCFVLKEVAADRYEQELNRVRIAECKRGPHWSIKYLDPSHLKERAIQEVRDQFRNNIYEWFKKNLPGYFVRSNSSQRFPMAELLCTKFQDIFCEKERSVHFDWRRLISNVSLQEIWSSKDSSALKFTLKQEQRSLDQANLLIASTSLLSFSEERIKTYGGGTAAVVQICHEQLNGALVCFGISVFLKEVTRDLKSAREQLNFSKSNRETLQTIDFIRKFFDRNAGVPAVARELREHTKAKGFFEYYCERFTAPPWSNDLPVREFAKEIRESVHFRASALIEDESSTREHFEQLSTILSIRESIRAQRRMEVLTVAALLVAAVSLAAAFPDGWVADLKVALFKLQS